MASEQIDPAKAEKERKIDEENRKIVFEGAKAIFKAGLVEMGEGNVSIRVKKKDEMYITPSQNDYATMTEEDVVQLKFDGEHLSKGRRASSEYLMHKEFYEERKKAKCVIHCHPKHATMLAVAGKPLPLIIEEMAYFIGGQVNVSEFGESGTEEIGKKALEAMGDTNAVLIRNHGLLVCGKDMNTTVKTAMLVEKMAEIYIGALSLGPIEPLAEEKTAKWVEMFEGVHKTAPRKKKE